MSKSDSLNIETVNVLLILVGFPLFTTFVNSSIGSIAYRAVAMVIGILCVMKHKCHIYELKHNKSFKLFLVIYLILILKMLYEFYVGEDAYTPFTDSRSFATIFTLGIGWIPFWGAICGYKEINKRQVVIYSLYILLFIIILGILNRGANTNGFGRVSLNARQSTLAFGDNGAYLSIISAAILARLKEFSKFYLWIGLLGLSVGLYGTLIAGSRGPLVSTIAGLGFVFMTLGKSGKASIIILLIALMLSGVLNYGIIEKLSPTMAARMDKTIEAGDMSGREVLFENALDKIQTNLLWGSNPIILEPEGSFTGYHNVYLGTGVGLGLVGFLVFILLVFSILYRTLKIATRRLSIFELMILGLFWFYAVRGITGVGILTNTLYTVLFAFTCIIIYKKSSIRNYASPKNLIET